MPVLSNDMRLLCVTCQHASTKMYVAQYDVTLSICMWSEAEGA